MMEICRASVGCLESKFVSFPAILFSISKSFLPTALDLVRAAFDPNIDFWSLCSWAFRRDRLQRQQTDYSSSAIHLATFGLAQSKGTPIPARFPDQIHWLQHI